MSIRCAALVLLALALVSPRPAHAIHHFMTVGEVLLSSGGDTGIQYVELEDLFPEPFPDGTYDLELFDADAQPIGTVELTVPPQTARLLVATAAAEAEFLADADAALTVALPADGQACFSRTSGQKIHCLAWGCVDTLVVPSASTGASPADGVSLQRQPTGTYHVAAPTPDADNVAGTDDVPCPEPGQAVLTLLGFGGAFARRTLVARGSHQSGSTATSS
jgi:hypothetical protein